MKKYTAVAIMAAISASPVLAQDYKAAEAQIDALARGTAYPAPAPARVTAPIPSSTPSTAARPAVRAAPTHTTPFPVGPVALPASPPAASYGGPGRIVMYRPSAMIGLGLACPIRYRGQEIVELGRGKFAEWVVPAGSYILGNNTSSVEINVYPGETKFLRCQIKPGFITGRADLQIVDQEAFVKHASEYERKDVTASPGNPFH